MPRKAKPKPRRRAKPEPKTRPVICLCEEVFTGLWEPERLKKGEKAQLPLGVAEILIQSGACADG